MKGSFSPVGSALGYRRGGTGASPGRPGRRLGPRSLDNSGGLSAREKLARAFTQAAGELLESECSVEAAAWGSYGGIRSTQVAVRRGEKVGQTRPGLKPWAAKPKPTEEAGCEKRTAGGDARLVGSARLAILSDKSLCARHAERKCSAGACPPLPAPGGEALHYTTSCQHVREMARGHAHLPRANFPQTVLVGLRDLWAPRI